MTQQNRPRVSVNFQLPNENTNLIKPEDIISWSDEEHLENLRTILNSTQSGVAFLHNEDDLVIGYKIVFGFGDNLFSSDAVMFEWPMQYLPLPKAFEGKLN